MDAKIVLTGIGLGILLACTKPIEISQWRGPERDGKFSTTNLLKKWPENGPEMLWSFEELGDGHGNVGIGRDRLYICGMIDTIGHLFAFNLEGKLLWQRAYGLEWYQNYTGVRSTPTVVGDMVYFESGQGVVYCYDGGSGNMIWSVDILDKFQAENIQWGMAESLLVDGEMLYCTPGGKEHNIVALNRMTGETIWTSRGSGQPAAYCSPILINHNGIQLIVTMTSEAIVGVDARTGETYWVQEQRQRNFIHANTPLYHDGKILCSSSSDISDQDGTALLQLSNDGKKASVLWRNTKVANLMGGEILKDGFVYGSNYRSSEWYCLNWNSGVLEYVVNPFANGAIVYADGLFYCYTEGGEMALVDASPNEFNVISKFNITLGTNQHWAHPVIHAGRLYVRHGNALMVYNISK